MLKYVNYVNANARVLLDKTSDIISYYAGLSVDESSSTSDDDNNPIENYEDVINIELYENESKSNRIYPASGYYKEYSTFWSKPTHVVDNIYLGSAFNAARYDQLKDLNIKVIINATTEISNYFEDNNDFIYHRYKLYDNNKNSIKKYLEKSYHDIKNHQQNTSGNILIHCFMGASRSASIVLYYLMKTKKNEDGKSYSFDDSVKYLKSKRITVNPTFKLTKDLVSSIKVNN